MSHEELKKTACDLYLLALAGHNSTKSGVDNYIKKLDSLMEKFDSLIKDLGPWAMDTAPKDREILLLVNDEWNIGKWNTDERARNPEPFWQWSLISGKTFNKQFKPTMWMHLPKSP